MQHFIGCDVHTRYQVVAWIDEETGEIRKRRLEHGGEEVRKFYAPFPRGTVVGIEATFPALWFERLLGELGHELWVGDAARIRASEVRYQKTDPRDAGDILDLLRTGRFPRIWVPSVEERDLRQLLVHRLKLVRARTQVKNQLHALAISQGVCRKRKLWSQRGRAELERLELLPGAARRRKELLEWLDHLDAQVGELDRAVEEAGRARPEVALLRTHPGVGPVVALALVLTLGPIERFSNSRKLVSYLGLNPRERSSGGRQRLGSIRKQGNSLLRWLLVEAAQTAARLDPPLRRAYQRLKQQKVSGVAKVAVARRLAVRLFWMLRTRHNYAQLVHMSGSPSSASITASALSSNISPWGWRLGFSRAFPLVRFGLAHADQGSPRRISRWTAGVPPLIYAIPPRRDHDSPFDLPAWCGEARRPIRRSIPPSWPGPPRYSGYRTCERAARSCGACAASRKAVPPGGGPRRL
jgi:transposase